MAVQQPSAGVVCWKSDGDASRRWHRYHISAAKPCTGWFDGSVPIRQVEDCVVVAMEVNLSDLSVNAAVHCHVIIYRMITIGLYLEVDLPYVLGHKMSM